MTIFSTCCESPSRPNQSLLLGVKKKPKKQRNNPPPPKKTPKHCFCKVVQWAWHISSHLWFGIGTVMASLREVSKEVLLSAVHTYCTLIYNAYLVICCATCDCSSSGFLLLLPYAFFPLIVFLPITCFCNFFFLLRRVKKIPS